MARLKFGTNMPPPRISASFYWLIPMLPMVGAFASDAYLPSFLSISNDLGAPLSAVQQTLTFFLFMHTAMNLFHGAIADAVGRKPVLVISLVLFSLASIGCALATTLESLLIYRSLQGLAAGAGFVLTRAMVRDCFSGDDIQRQISRITTVFAIAPVLAPLLGGILVARYDWRAVFWALAISAAFLCACCILFLPETLDPGKKKRLRFRSLMTAYGAVVSNIGFLRLSGGVALVQAGLLVSVAASPAIILIHYRLPETAFYYQFAPMVAGIMLGSFVSGKLAGKTSFSKQLAFGIAAMTVAAATDMAFAVEHSPQRTPMVLAVIFLYAFGLLLVMPAVTGRVLSGFAENAGTASSCMAFLQGLGFAVVSGFVVPAVASSLLAIAAAKLLFLASGSALLWQSGKNAQAKTALTSP